MSRREVLWHFKSCLVMNSHEANSFPGTSFLFPSRFHFPFQLFLQLDLSKLLSKPQRAIFPCWSYNTLGLTAQRRLASHAIHLVTLRVVLMTRDFPSQTLCQIFPTGCKVKRYNAFSISER